MIVESPLAQIAFTVTIGPFTPRNETAPNAAALPLVVAHGMGDSCFNGGMKSITKVE